MDALRRSLDISRNGMGIEHLQLTWYVNMSNICPIQDFPSYQHSQKKRGRLKLEWQLSTNTWAKETSEEDSEDRRKWRLSVGRYIWNFMRKLYLFQVQLSSTYMNRVFSNVPSFEVLIKICICTLAYASAINVYHFLINYYRQIIS